MRSFFDASDTWLVSDELDGKLRMVPDDAVFCSTPTCSAGGSRRRTSPAAARVPTERLAPSPQPPRPNASCLLDDRRAAPGPRDTLTDFPHRIVDHRFPPQGV